MTPIKKTAYALLKWEQRSRHGNLFRLVSFPGGRGFGCVHRQASMRK